MKCTVHHADGRPVEEHDSIQQAMESLLDYHVEGVAVDAGGFEVDRDTPDECYDIRSGRAALVWADAEDAGQAGTGDDGSRAVAEIMIVEAE